MKFPCCRKDMEQGFLQSMQRMAFVKKPHKVSLLPKNGEVLLGNHAVSSLAFPATICKSCEKVLLDYSQAQASKKS